MTEQATPDERIEVRCAKCRGVIVLEGEDAEQWNPTAIVMHGEGLCEGEETPPQSRYSISLVLTAVDGKDVDPDAEPDFDAALSRVTVHATDRTFTLALPTLTRQLEEALQRLVKFGTLADQARDVTEVGGAGDVGDLG